MNTPLTVILTGGGVLHPKPVQRVIGRKARTLFAFPSVRQGGAILKKTGEYGRVEQKNGEKSEKTDRSERAAAMEFHEKLQELRKQKDLTQEELASALYVSRAAVSKWESGRGYPNIDSLKAIADFYGVSIDSLLSCDKVLTLAQEDNRQRQSGFRDLVFGLIDLGHALFFVLPLFGQRIEGRIYEVPLLSLTAVEPYLRVLFFTVVIGLVVFGGLTLTLQQCHIHLWERSKTKVSLILNAVGAALFVLSLQPYAAILMLVFLAIKVLILSKRR